MCILNLIHANTSFSAPVSSRSAKVPKRHKISKAEMAQNVKLQLKYNQFHLKVIEVENLSRLENLARFDNLVKFENLVMLENLVSSC